MPPWMSHFECDTEAVIIGSYADQFGGGDHDGDYTVMLPDGNESSWYEEDQLTLIDEGGEHLIKKGEEKQRLRSQKNTDMRYIISCLDSGEMPTESILYLFDILGFNSKFTRTGEYCHLYADWKVLKLVFMLIKNAKTIEEAKSLFTEVGWRHCSVEKLYNAFKEAQK